VCNHHAGTKRRQPPLLGHTSSSTTTQTQNHAVSILFRPLSSPPRPVSLTFELGRDCNSVTGTVVMRYDEFEVKIDPACFCDKNRWWRGGRR
ncbi:hypothetical protein L195_g055890, partial [Trifolium pratense]